MDDIYIYDEVCSLVLYEGLAEAKTVLKQAEFAIASTRARGGHSIKFIHDKTLGSSMPRLREEVRRLFRAKKKAGKLILMLPGEDFSMSNPITQYLADKLPSIELDPDMDQKKDTFTIVYF